MAVSYATYERLALEDTDTEWELVCGKLREKQPMTQEHNRLARRLSQMLAKQLDFRQFDVGESIRLRVTAGTFLLPDLVILPAGYESHQSFTGHLEVYEGPVAFVMEVWSPSTGQRDLETKLPFYKERGDQEIWQVNPLSRSLIAWRRNSDGSYGLVPLSGSVIRIAAANVDIDLVDWFEVLDS